MSRFVHVGFDRETSAEKFQGLILGNRNVVSLYEKYQDEEGNTKGRVHNIQSRSVHIGGPDSWRRRSFEFPGVAIEFQTQIQALEFMRIAANFVSGIYGTGEVDTRDDAGYIDAAFALVALLKGDNIAGIRMERE